MATDETRSTSPAAPRPRRLARALLAAAALAAAWGAFGFLLAPRLVRRAIEEKGSAALHRAVTVQAVEINPFTLRLAVLGLTVAGRGGTALASWEALRVRLAPWKALSGDVGLAELRLLRPVLRLRLDEQGRLDVRDLVEGDAPAPGAAAPAPEPARPARFGLALDLLEIVEGQVAFVDASVTPTFQSTLGPFTVTLRDFRSRGGADSPYSFEGTTEAGETFSWSGTVDSAPVRSSGTISFAGVKLPKYGPYLRGQAPNLEVRRGTAAVKTRYELEWGGGRNRVQVQGLTLSVADLALAQRGQEPLAVELPSIEVGGVDVDVLGQVAAVGEVKLSGGAIQARRLADGTINLVELARLPPSPPSRWTWRVGALALERLAVGFEDLAAPRPARLDLTDVALRLTGLAKGSGAPCPFTASLRQGAAGTLSVKGTVKPFAPAGELAVEGAGLELTALTPWLDRAPVRLADGKLGLGLRTTFDASGAEAAWTVGGDLRVEGLSLLHPARNEELVRWKALEVLGLDAASAGRRAGAKTVRLVEPRLRAVIFEDGTTGLGKAAPPATTAATPAPTAAPQPAVPGWRTAIGLLQIVRGRASLVDRSVSPPVLLSLTDVEARIADLSSDPRVRSRVDVKARVEGSAPVTVSGTLNPLQANAFTQLAVTSKAIDLTPLGPYAGKHLGYGLQKGKLDLDLTYTVQDGAVVAGNVVRLDQLTLGEKTDSQDATGLPVRLALALLRDKDGVILLDVPVEGRLDDPEFKLGRVIWRTVLNLLVKVATSPFSALAALAGGGDADLSLVEFAPGQAALDEAAQKRVQALARSLAERPALALELEGTADAAADGAALRRAELERLLRRAKAAAQKPPAAEEAVTVAPEERARWVAAAAAALPPVPPVKAAPGQPAPPPPPLPTPAELEERLLASIEVPPEALPALAAARTTAAREALLAAGLDPGRLFQVEGSERAAREKGARAYFSVQSR